MINSRRGGTTLAGLEIGTIPRIRSLRTDIQVRCFSTILGSADGIRLAAWWDWRHSCHRYTARLLGITTSVLDRISYQKVSRLFGLPRGMLPASTSALYCLTASGVLYQRLPRFIAATRPCRTNQPR